MKTIITTCLILLAPAFATAQSKTVKQYLAGVNNLRANPQDIDGTPKQVLPPVTYNPILQRCATSYAALCAKQGWSHYTGGTGPYERAIAAGYFAPDAAAPFGYFGSVGECLAWPKRVDPITAWTWSDPHRNTICWYEILTNGNLRTWVDAGIGESGGPRGGWVLMLGWRLPKSEP